MIACRIRFVLAYICVMLSDFFVGYRKSVQSIRKEPAACGPTGQGQRDTHIDRLEGQENINLKQRLPLIVLSRSPSAITQAGQSNPAQACAIVDTPMRGRSTSAVVAARTDILARCRRVRVCLCSAHVAVAVGPATCYAVVGLTVI
jgi:hypothetical protein